MEWYQLGYDSRVSSDTRPAAFYDIAGEPTLADLEFRKGWETADRDLQNSTDRDRTNDQRRDSTGSRIPAPLGSR